MVSKKASRRSIRLKPLRSDGWRPKIADRLTDFGGLVL
ncbi:hypothetical protein [Microviridae sp.]|nr:hypothetical protein [Microviridae sp.]